MRSGEIRFARKKWWFLSPLDPKKGVCRFDDGSLAHFTVGLEALECRDADGHALCSVDLGSDLLPRLCFGEWQRTITGAPENPATLFIKHQFLTLEIAGQRRSVSAENFNEKAFFYSIRTADLTLNFTLQDSVPVWPTVTAMFVDMLLRYAGPGP